MPIEFRIMEWCGVGKYIWNSYSFRITFWKHIWKIAVTIFWITGRTIIKNIAIFHYHSVFYNALLPLIIVLDTINFK